MRFNRLVYVTFTGHVYAEKDSLVLPEIIASHNNVTSA